jgi:hypothetical protein
MMTLYSSAEYAPAVGSKAGFENKMTTFISVTVPLGGLSRADGAGGLLKQHQSNQNNIPAY